MLSKGKRSGRCSLGLLLHTGATPMDNGICSLGLLLHTGATSMGNVRDLSGSQPHSGATTAGNVEESGDLAFLRQFFLSRSKETGALRLGLQLHTGITAMGNVCWSGLQSAAVGRKDCEEWKQVRGTDTPTRSEWPVVPQKVTPNSSPVMCQYKRK